MLHIDTEPKVPGTQVNDYYFVMHNSFELHNYVRNSYSVLPSASPAAFEPG